MDAPITYEAVVEGLHERFATVKGIMAILDYEPKAIQTTPTLYSLLDRFDRSQEGQLTVMKYRVLNRLCIQWQDNEQAERQLAKFVNPLPASIDKDPKLGGRVSRGMAWVTEAPTGFFSIGDTTYRVLDMYVEVLTKGAFKSGI
jgi:hypothetical protein